MIMNWPFKYQNSLVFGSHCLFDVKPVVVSIGHSRIFYVAFVPLDYDNGECLLIKLRWTFENKEVYKKQYKKYQLLVKNNMRLECGGDAFTKQKILV